jgi:O-antigen/teichoic acid export membrane protein
MKLLRAFSIYFGCALLNQAVSFVLLPVFTHHLTPYDYGVLSLVNNSVAVFSVLVMMGADGAARREFYRVEGPAFATFLSSGFATTMGSFLLVFLGTWALSSRLEASLAIPGKWLLLSPVVALAAVAPTLLLGQYRVNQQAGSYALLSTAMTVANLGLGVWLVAYRRMGYEGRLYGLLGAGLLFFVVAVVILRRKGFLVPNGSWAEAKASLRYGLPIIPHHLGSLVIVVADRFFIARMVNVAETGIYHVGYTVGSIIGVLQSTFSVAFTPYLFERLKENTDASRRAVVRTSYLFIAGLAVCVLLVYLASEILFSHLIGERFRAGRVYVLWIAIGYFFSGCYKLVVGYIFYASRTIYLTYLAFLNVALSFTLNYLFIKRWGAIGAAWSTMVSFLVMFLLTACLAHRLQPMPWLRAVRITPDRT